LAEGQAAHGFGEAAAGVANEMDIAGADAEVALGHDARIHTGDDGEALAGWRRGTQCGLRRLHPGVVAQDVVDRGHAIRVERDRCRRVARRCGQATSLSWPTVTSKTKPRTGMSCRTSGDWL